MQWRAEVVKPPLWPSLPGIEAIATDGTLAMLGKPALALSDISGIADFINQHAAESVCTLSTEARYPRERFLVALPLESLNPPSSE